MIEPVTRLAPEGRKALDVPRANDGRVVAIDMLGQHSRPLIT